MKQSATTQKAMYLAQFPSEEALIKAAQSLAKAGAKDWDCYAPYPIHGLSEAMGLKSTREPYVVYASGIASLIAIFGLTYVTQVIIYPTNVQGKPANINTIAAFIPDIVIALLLLITVGALAGFFMFTKLPQLHHPLFAADKFRAVTSDGYFIAAEIDAKEESSTVLELLENLSGHKPELVEDDNP